MTLLNLCSIMTMEVEKEKGQENRIFSIEWHYCQQSSGFKNRDLSLKSYAWWDWPYFVCSPVPINPLPGSVGRQNCADPLKPKQSSTHRHKELGFQPVKEK